MKTGKKLRKLSKIALLTALGIFLSCNSDNSTEQVQKLLDKQAQTLEEQQESMEDIMEQFKLTRDSLNAEQEKLLSAKEDVDNEIERVTKLQSDIEKTITKKQADSLEQVKNNLENQRISLADSLNAVHQQISQMDRREEELDLKKDHLTDQMGTAREDLVTGIKKIDQRLEDLNSQRGVKEKELLLNKQKIDLAQQKIEILETEKGLYQDEKNDMLKKGADDDELEDFNLKIRDIDNSILEEKNKIKNAENSIQSIKSWTADLEKLESRLKEAMEQEYNENETLKQFAEGELNRLNSEKENVNAEIKRLDSIQNVLNAQITEAEKELENVDDELSLISGNELADILVEKSKLESSEARLSKQEEELLISSPEDQYAVSGINNDLLLQDLDKELSESRNLIDSMKSEIAREQQKLAQKKAEAEERRANRAKAAGITTLVIILAGILLVLLFYYIGKRKRS